MVRRKQASIAASLVSAHWVPEVPSSSSYDNQNWLHTLPNSPWRAKLPQLENIALNSAAAAKSFQSCPTLCNPIDGSPPGSPIPGILQARILEWVAISFSNAWKWKVKVKSLSLVRLFSTPWIAAHQPPPSIGFSRQEYWGGVPLPRPISRSWPPVFF